MQQEIKATDPRLSRAKYCLVPMALMVQALNQLGHKVLKVDGWPAEEDDAQIIGMNVMMTENTGVNIMFTLYSPKFPLVLARPPMMGLKWEWRLLPDAFEWDDLIVPAPDAEVV